MFVSASNLKLNLFPFQIQINLTKTIYRFDKLGRIFLPKKIRVGPYFKKKIKKFWLEYQKNDISFESFKQEMKTLRKICHDTNFRRCVKK